MLLLHQTGSVKVGEVVRYQITYTPSLDRILPPPTHLHVKIKNTSAIPLRAAYLHGPYTLYVSGVPSTFNPDVKFEGSEDEGEPDYEPQLKAGGHWYTKLKVPESIRENPEDTKVDKNGERKHFTWIVEIASQVLFSTSAAVHYEFLVGRDEKSVQSGLTGSIQVGAGHGLPGKLEDLQKKRQLLSTTEQTKGVFSKAITLEVDDTETLWNSPSLPSWENSDGTSADKEARESDPLSRQDNDTSGEGKNSRRQKKLHLVVLTHGLHSNLGADMLYMKESIDAAAKKAREDARESKAKLRVEQAKEANEFGRATAGLESHSVPEIAVAPTASNFEANDDEDDEEEVIVRGFSGNAVKTEKGIQYLGKRLAKYVLSMTYPDQPYLPVKSSISKTITRSFTNQRLSEDDASLTPTHKNSTIVKDEKHSEHDLPYRITSISFIGHSLGGLIQTYAVAYIMKHSPDFFELIRPINFVALATPFLGLSNENPLYVKFALDFGLVGRTGQDLGLTWRAPTIARSGWGAMVNGLVNDPHKDREPDPGSKPLLRILPTGPAHKALKKFRNRTVYSNVVNDGIVPLRTSCLLFLDWRGLERVEKARRDNGLVGTMVNWGWNEVTGQNVSTARKPITWNDLFSDNGDDDSNSNDDPGSTVPQAEASQGLDYDQVQARRNTPSALRSGKSDEASYMKEDARQQETNAWTALLSYFKPQAGSKPRKDSVKPAKIYRRGQTMSIDGGSGPDTTDSPSPPSSPPMPRKGLVRGPSLYIDSASGNVEAPPKTSVFEAAGDILNPPLAPKDFLLDPAARPRTIFHDRVYHPDDIPTPPIKRTKTFMGLGSSRNSSQDNSASDQTPENLDKVTSPKNETAEQGTMKIEEKIARAYHRDMSWRKVLVRLEPDAHNNLIVRRMFANAYGWPVVKHLCDTHFAHTAAALTRDEDESPVERAKADHEAVGEDGEKVKGQEKPPDDKLMDKSNNTEQRHHSADGHAVPKSTGQTERKSLHARVKQRESADWQSPRSSSEIRESRDEVSDLVSMVTASGQTSSTFSSMHSGSGSASTSATATLHRLQRKDSGRWSDRFFEGTDDDSDDEDASYTRELMNARARGEIITYDHHGIHTDEHASEPKNEVSINSTILAGQSDVLVREPGKMHPDESLFTSDPSTSDQDSTLQTTNLTSVGLGLGGSQDITPTASPDNQRRSSTGIAEQVAVAHGRTGSAAQENKLETQ